jgi:hypothetical protein
MLFDAETGTCGKAHHPTSCLGRGFLALTIRVCTGLPGGAGKSSSGSATGSGSGSSWPIASIAASSTVLHRPETVERLPVSVVEIEFG